jgi:DNA repair protein RecO (recombination protein O)
MSQTYSLTAMNLQIKPIGEADRLVTVLSAERGLMTVMAAGARKPKAKLGGRTGLFLINELLLVKGRSFDRIIQAETLESYPGLTHSLEQLAAAQYLIELTLGQALWDHPQVELFMLLRGYLKHLEQASSQTLLPCLAQGSFHLLSLAGIAPQVYYCCRSQRLIEPNFQDRYWRVGFSIVAGGVVSLDLHGQPEDSSPKRTIAPLTAWEFATLQQIATGAGISPHRNPESLQESSGVYQVSVRDKDRSSLDSFSQEIAPHLSPVHPSDRHLSPQVWLKLERLLRDYAQYHLECPLRSATLLDSAFNAPPTSAPKSAPTSVPNSAPTSPYALQ